MRGGQGPEHRVCGGGGVIDRVLEHLAWLVGFDTSDPASTVTGAHPIIVRCARELEAAGCEVLVEDLGGGSVNVLAVRGEPRVLFNCHLDTVRADGGWMRDPFSLAVKGERNGGWNPPPLSVVDGGWNPPPLPVVEGERVFGLGACDIKGAAACLLVAAKETDGPLAVLLTTDEEGGKGRCIGHFLKTREFEPDVVVVCEPTGCEAVAGHRGFASFEVSFRGGAGHTSLADATVSSAVHHAVRWANEALSIAETELGDGRFNIGIIEGGTASNVVASSARVRFGYRPLPGAEAAARGTRALQRMEELLPSSSAAAWTERFVGPALEASAAVIEAIGQWGVSCGPDVDFWTEAGLFAADGLPAVVIGPGDIAQAHAADEFVEVEQLARCAVVFCDIIGAPVHAVAGGGSCVS